MEFLLKYKKMKEEKIQRAVEAGLQEFKRSLDGPWGGSRLPNQVPIGRVTGNLRRNSFLVKGNNFWEIINTSSYWPFLRDGTSRIEERGSEISDRVLARIRRGLK